MLVYRDLLSKTKRIRILTIWISLNNKINYFPFKNTQNQICQISIKFKVLSFSSWVLVIFEIFDRQILQVFSNISSFSNFDRVLADAYVKQWF